MDIRGTRLTPRSRLVELSPALSPPDSAGLLILRTASATQETPRRIPRGSSADRSDRIGRLDAAATGDRHGAVTPRGQLIERAEISLG